jgi:hypothetical protein
MSTAVWTCFKNGWQWQYDSSQSTKKDVHKWSLCKTKTRWKDKVRIDKQQRAGSNTRGNLWDYGEKWRRFCCKTTFLWWKWWWLQITVQFRSISNKEGQSMNQITWHTLPSASVMYSILGKCYSFPQLSIFILLPQFFRTVCVMCFQYRTICFLCSADMICVKW